MEELSSLGARVAGLRAERGVSAQEAADAIGVSRPYLSGIENGLDLPGFETFVAIADYYDVSLDWLAKGAPYPRGQFSPADAQLLKDLGAQSEDVRNFLRMAIEGRTQQPTAPPTEPPPTAPKSPRRAQPRQIASTRRRKKGP